MLSQDQALVEVDDFSAPSTDGLRLLGEVDYSQGLPTLGFLPQGQVALLMGVSIAGILVAIFGIPFIKHKDTQNVFRTVSGTVASLSLYTLITKEYMA